MSETTVKEPELKGVDRLKKIQQAQTEGQRALNTAQADKTASTGVPKSVNLRFGEDPTTSRSYEYWRAIRGLAYGDWGMSKVEHELAQNLEKYIRKDSPNSILIPWTCEPAQERGLAQINLPETPQLELERRAQFGEQNTGVGGTLVFPFQATEIIRRLAEKMVVLKAAQVMGANIERTLPPTGQLNIPVRTGKTSFYWLGGGSTITDTDATGLYTQLQLRAKKGAQLVFVDNELIRDAIPSVEEDIRAELILKTAEEEDKQFLIGAVANPQVNPIGLLNVSSPEAIQLAVSPATGASAAITVDNLYDMLQLFVQGKGDLNKAVWFVSPRTRYGLAKAKTDIGSYLIQPAPSLALPDTMLGHPVFVSTQIPVNVTASDSTANTTYVFLCQIDELIVARHMVMEIAVDQSFRFQSDQITIRAIERLDFGVKHPKTVVVAQGVTN